MNESSRITLKRSLSLPLLALYGLGSIVGAGIYVLVGEVAGLAGMYAPAAFLTAALIAAFTGLSYAELSARLPRSAGEAVYVRAAFGRDWLANATGWAIVLTGIVSSATLASGIAGYAGLFLDWPAPVITAVFVLTLGTLACWGMHQSAWAAAAMTVLSILGLLLVAVAASDAVATVPSRWRDLLPPPEWGAWQGIVLGSFLAFYAFIGFEDIVNVAEEVRDPERTLPAAILLALVGATLLYALIAVTAVVSAPAAELAASPAPLVTIVGEGSWLSAPVIAAFSAVAITNSVLPQLIMGSRVVYGLACQGAAPALFARVNDRTHTPLAATVTIMLCILFMATFVPLVTLAKITSFVVLVIFTLVNLAALALKLRRVPGPVHFPVWVSATGAVLCVLLVAAELMSRFLS